MSDYIFEYVIIFVILVEYDYDNPIQYVDSFVICACISCTL